MDNKNNYPLDSVSAAYAEFAQKVLDNGVLLGNRTKYSARRAVGISTELYLSPFMLSDRDFRLLHKELFEAGIMPPPDLCLLAASSQRKLPVKSAIAELIGFLRGYDNAEDFAKLGCRFWFKNANETPEWLHNPNRKGDNDLGRIYGKQWTDWKCADGTSINQVKSVIDSIINDPLGRRHIINGWRPDELDQQALPPCHLLYQFFPNPNTGMMDLLMYQRSVDTFLGLPANWVACSVLLAIICRFTGYKPGKLSHMGGDCHIYSNAEEALKEVIARPVQKTYPPALYIDERIKRYEGTDFPYELMLDLQPSDIHFFGYCPGEAISVEMAE